jgi:hypothetical protein
MKKFLFAVFFLSLFAIDSFAEEKDFSQNLQMFNTLSYLEGKAFKSKTQKEVLNNFIEYPLSKKHAIGSNIFASRIESDHNGSTTAYALNSAEIFHRYKFFSYKKLGIQVHNSYTFRGPYNENKYLALMPRQQDYELRFLFALNMQDRLINTVIQNSPYFARFEIAYRARFENPFDEIRYNLWAGFKINEDFGFLLNNNITWNVANKATKTNNSNVNLADFRASKDANNMATFSLMYHQNKNLAWQFGYTRRLHGNNPFYDYQGVLAGLWSSF